MQPVTQTTFFPRPWACSSSPASSSQCSSGWAGSQGSDKVPTYFAALLTFCPVPLVVTAARRVVGKDYLEVDLDGLEGAKELSSTESHKVIAVGTKDVYQSLC